MARKKEIVLPKLPRGMGSYAWRDEEHTIIEYKKMIGDDLRKRHTVYGSTISECNKKMEEEEKIYIEECKRKLRTNPRNSSLPIKIAVYNWMTTFKIKTLKGKSYDTLEQTYNNQLLTSEFANKQIEQIDDIDIQNWLNDIIENKSASTAKKAYSLLKMFMEYYYIKRPYDNPMVAIKVPQKNLKIELDEKGLPINPNKAYAVLDDEEIYKFTEEAARPLKAGISGYMHGYFFIFCMWSFMRYGEALALQWKDIDFEKKGVYVYKTYSYIVDRSGEESKNKRKWELTIAKTMDGIRYEYLCDNAIQALQEYRIRKKTFINDDDFVFTTENGKPIPNDYLNRTLKNILQKANIKTNVTIHGLRHTGISYFLRHGIDISVISKQAGHASTEITQKIYYTITQDQYKREIAKINEKNAK